MTQRTQARPAAQISANSQGWMQAIVQDRYGMACRSVARLRRSTTSDQPGVECSFARGSSHRAAGSSRAPSTSDAKRRIG